MADFFWFSDSQWAWIKPLLPTDVRGKARVDDRRVLSGIVHALRCGGRWDRGGSSAGRPDPGKPALMTRGRPISILRDCSTTQTPSKARFPAHGLEGNYRARSEAQTRMSRETEIN